MAERDRIERRELAPDHQRVILDLKAECLRCAREGDATGRATAEASLVKACKVVTRLDLMDEFGLSEERATRMANEECTYEVVYKGGRVEVIVRGDVPIRRQIQPPV